MHDPPSTIQLADRYTYRVICSEEDSEYVGLCAEFPSLSWLDGTRDRALAGVVRLVHDTVTDMVEHREAPPVPLATKEYSGIFKVRIPPIVHRNLVIEAAEAGVSLNRLVGAKLAHG